MKRTAKQIQGRPYVSPRTFFDNGSHEYTKKPLTYKIERLMEYVKSGYSLRRWIIEYKNYYNNERYQYMRGYLESTLNIYIDYFKTGQVKQFYLENPYSDDLNILIPLLETAIKEAIEKEPGYKAPIKRKIGKSRFNTIKIKALLNSFIHNQTDYKKWSEATGIDFNKDITVQLEQRDKAEKLDYPNSYVHLKSLLFQNIFYALKENYYEELFPQMGCSKNQLHYLKLYADKTRNKSNVYKKAMAIDLALELIKIVYFNGKTNKL